MSVDSEKNTGYRGMRLPTQPLYMRRLFVAAAHNLQALLEAEATLECRGCGNQSKAGQQYLSAWGKLVCPCCHGDNFKVLAHPEGAKECGILMDPEGITRWRTDPLRSAGRSSDSPM